MHYRLYLLDDDGRIVDVVEQPCVHDLDALEKARSLAEGRDIEIRAGARKVGRVKTGDAPLDARNSSSL
jgi:hypothetical protein